MYCPSHTTQKDISETCILQYHYIINPRLPSEIRSLWTIPSRGAPTHPAQIDYIYYVKLQSPYMSTRKRSTKILYNKTLLQQILLAGLQSGRYGPSIPVAPLQSCAQLLLLYKDIRPHIRIARICSKKNLSIDPSIMKPLLWSEIRTLWAINPRGAPTFHAQIDSLYYVIVIVPLDACYNNTPQRHFTAIYVCNTISTRV